MADERRVGFIGLGAMGGPMASRLLDAGFEVHGYNRTASRAQPLQERGMVLERSPAEVGRAAPVVVTMVRDDAALAAVAEGAEGLLSGLQPGSIWIEMSTVSPSCSERLAVAAEALGASFLQAPVSGSVPHAQSGTLTIIVSGELEPLEQARTVLANLGQTIHHVGPRSAALYLKLAINLSIAVQVIGFAEGVVLASRHGVDPGQAVEVLLTSAIASPMLKGRGPLALARRAEAWFDVGLMQKDLQLALSQAHQTGVALPLSALSQQLFSATRALGLADEDVIAVYDLLDRMAAQPQPVES